VTAEPRRDTADRDEDAERRRFETLRDRILEMSRPAAGLEPDAEVFTTNEVVALLAQYEKRRKRGK
jgi:hypothetical protein